MSKTLFFPLVCLCLLFCTATAQAQRAVVSSDKARGSFQISNQGPAAIDVRYTVTPAYPDNLTFLVQSATEFTIRAHVVDAKSREVLKIEPTLVNGRHAASLNLASLQPGHYFIEIENSDVAGSTFRVPFDISKAK